MRKFAASMPAHIAETFSDAQLRAIIRAYGVRSWGRHAIDIRFALPVLTRTYYFVFLAGIDKRPRSRNRAERHSHPLATLGNFLFLSLVLLLLLSFVLGLFYVLKSAFGLNIAPGFSLGVWDSIQSEVGGL
ncbi:MAG: 3-phosphoshikimate 1-carboxyvinyltransferase [Alphaproteobacteria bacterium]|nr:3-phosphoshikimate 1-carboxyvinyltransferase [Alphaproteobacteria bacterium]